jgi:GT2 family glycosyltransferase
MASEKPLVSIIVVSHNEINHIFSSLSALMGQTYPNYEVILYDNGSTDGTPEYVLNYFPRVKLVKGTHNLGFGGANNKAAEIALGKYLGFLNCDAIVSSGWLEPMVSLLERDDSIGCVGAELICSENKKIILSHGTGIHLSGISYAKDRGKYVQNNPPIEVGGISGGAFLINKEYFFKVGAFESLFFLYYEDTDLALRIRLSGKRCMIIPGAKVYHNCESRFGTRKIFFLERNRYLSLFSLMSLPMLCMMTPSLTVFEIFSWGYCLIIGKDAIVSKYKAWKEIFELHSWIKLRREKYKDNQTTLGYLLQAFSPFVYIEYVHSNKAISLVSLFVGYLLAIPVFFFLRLFTGRDFLK